jgi:hypothetical protein
MDVTMSQFGCDYKDNCTKKPYMEAYEVKGKKHAWYYLCFWHYLLTRIKRKGLGYCKVDTDREMLERIMEEIWDIQGDLIQIKEKLKIKSDYEELDVLKKLWDNPEDDAWDELINDEKEIKKHNLDIVKSKKKK